LPAASGGPAVAGAQRFPYVQPYDCTRLTVEATERCSLDDLMKSASARSRTSLRFASPRARKLTVLVWHYHDDDVLRLMFHFVAGLPLEMPTEAALPSTRTAQCPEA
jgi:hypothetical protein